MDTRRKSGNIVEISKRTNLGDDVILSQGGTVHLKKMGWQGWYRTEAIDAQIEMTTEIK